MEGLSLYAVCLSSNYELGDQWIEFYWAVDSEDAEAHAEGQVGEKACVFAVAQVPSDYTKAPDS